MHTKQQRAWSAIKIVLVSAVVLFMVFVYIKSILYVKYWFTTVCVLNSYGIQECDARIASGNDAYLNTNQELLLTASSIVIVFGSIVVVYLAFCVCKEIYERIENKVNYPG